MAVCPQQTKGNTTSKKISIFIFKKYYGVQSLKKKYKKQPGIHMTDKRPYSNTVSMSVENSESNMHNFCLIRDHQSCNALDNTFNVLDFTLLK